MKIDANKGIKATKKQGPSITLPKSGMNEKKKREEEKANHREEAKEF